MYAGQMVEEGDAGSVLKSPRHPYTEALLKCRPTLGRRDDARNERRLPVIPGEPPDLTAHSKGCAYEPRCADSMKICSERAPEMFDGQNGGTVRCFKFGG